MAATPIPWQNEMNAFREQDRKTPPLVDPVVFTGSSTFTLWNATVAADFAPLPVLGRGFGGSQYSDVLRDLDLQILGYHPRAVVLYSGDNDVASGKKPEQVAADLESIVTRTRAVEPRVPFYVCSIKPSPTRWTLWPELSKAGYDQRFYRMWKYYLHSCAGFFRSGNGQLWQMVFSPSGRHEVYRSVR